MKREINYENRYFEAKIQLRPANEEVIKFIDHLINHKKGVSIAKIILFDYGLDIYISSNKFAVQIGKLLKRKFKGELKISKKLFTQDKLTSKQKYRMTICFKLDPEEIERLEEKE